MLVRTGRVASHTFYYIFIMWGSFVVLVDLPEDHHNKPNNKESDWLPSDITQFRSDIASKYLTGGGSRLEPYTLH